MGIAVGGAVLVMALIAALIYCIRRRRTRSAVSTTPAGFQARADAPKLDEVAALSLVATTETVAPVAAATTTSDIALTEISRHDDTVVVPEIVAVPETVAMAGGEERKEF